MCAKQLQYRDCILPGSTLQCVWAGSQLCWPNHSAILQLPSCCPPMRPSQNEADIAAALRDAGIPRSSVFITSKVSPYQQGTDKASTACADILARLDTDYVDLMLIHWPGVARLDAQSPDNAKLRLETWRVGVTVRRLETCTICLVLSHFQQVAVSNKGSVKQCVAALWFPGPTNQQVQTTLHLAGSKDPAAEHCRSSAADGTT